MVSSVFSGVFASVSNVCFKCSIHLQTYVASDAFECFKSRSGVASPSWPSATSSWCLLLLMPARHPPPPPSLLDAGDFQGGAGPMWSRETVREKDYRHGRPDAQAIWMSRR
jgi:hypothetical protein